MERAEIKCSVGICDVYMEEIIGGYCLVGPPEMITHMGAAFEVLLTAFPRYGGATKLT